MAIEQFGSAFPESVQDDSSPGEVPIPEIEEELRREHYPLREAVQEVGTAEEIAIARTEIENKIADDDLPVDQWKEFFYSEVMPRHPSLVHYEEFFDKAINYSQLVSLAVEDTWRSTWSQIQEGHPYAMTEEGQREVENTVSKVLFRKLFGKSPKGEIWAMHGPISFNFVIHDLEDYEAAYGESAREVRGTKGFKSQKKLLLYGDDELPVEVPVVAIRFGEEMGMVETAVHELRHAKHSLIEIGQNVALDELLRSTIDERVVPERVGRWEADSLQAERWAKDEILAKMAGWVALAEEAGESLSMEKANELLKTEVGHQEGFYFKLYFDKWRDDLDKNIPLEEQQTRYQHNVQRGIDALERLSRLYKGDIRMTMNVIEQFPLHKWPAAVRLIEMKHRQEQGAVD